MIPETELEIDVQRLLDLLDEHRQFIEASASSFDEGFEAEAKRLAVVIRVLVHDAGRNSVSLLHQLGLKEKLAFFDSSEGISEQNLLSTPGLAVLYNPSGSSEGKYYAPLDDLPPFRVVRRSPFSTWWEAPVTRELSGAEWTRKDYVRVLANKEGGAHVDPRLDQKYLHLVHDNGLGIEFSDSQREPSVQLSNNIVLASVRQIAHELHKTLARPAYSYPPS